MLKNKLLSNVRDTVKNQGVVRRFVLPFVKYYRQVVFHFGSDTYELSLSTGESAVFKSETMAEIRHFYPIYGEIKELEDLLDELGKEDIFFDIGSHVGIYSIISATTIEENQIFAFEPHPLNVKRMKENMKLNNIRRINIFEVGLSDEDIVGELSVDGKEPGAVGHSVDRRNEAYEIKYQEGDKIIKEENLPKPNIIKIDVEGAELKVLRGLENSLQNCRVCYAEVSDDLKDFGECRQELFKFFEERGFQKKPIGTSADERGNYKFYRD